MLPRALFQVRAGTWVEPLTFCKLADIKEPLLEFKSTTVRVEHMYFNENESQLYVKISIMYDLTLKKWFKISKQGSVLRGLSENNARSCSRV